jgi:hypothetical protein
MCQLAAPLPGVSLVPCVPPYSRRGEAAGHRTGAASEDRSRALRARRGRPACATGGAPAGLGPEKVGSRPGRRASRSRAALRPFAAVCHLAGAASAN